MEFQQELIKAIKQNPTLFIKTYPELAKSIIGNSIAGDLQNYAGFTGAIKPQFKHGNVDPLSDGTLPERLNETAFFIDCTLESPIINTVITPHGGILSLIPAVPSNQTVKNMGFISAIGDDDDFDPHVERDGECDPSPNIDQIIASCKVACEFGVRARQTRTGSIKSILQKACDGEFEDYYFVGDSGLSGIRGVSDVPASRLALPNDRDLIIEGRVRRALSHLGKNQAKWLMAQAWVGDGTGTPNGGYRQVMGLLNWIRDDYTEVGNPITVTSSPGADCTVLNSCVIDAGDECICGGNTSIYELMQEAESEAYSAADGMGLLPVDGYIFMHPILWDEMIKCLPCEMLGTGCGIPGNAQQTLELSVVNGNDFELRQKLASEMIININSRAYKVETDPSMPLIETFVDPVWEYSGSIVFVPFTVNGGERVLTLEYLDYSQIESEFGTGNQDLLAWSGLNGWSDGGRYHTIVKSEERCFQVDVEMCPRICFKAPHLAWRIDNLKACVTKRRRIANTNQFSM